MAKTATIMTRVDPYIKEQAEYILGELGLPMATAMEVFLRQIVFFKKIPFEIKLPEDMEIEKDVIHF